MSEQIGVQVGVVFQADAAAGAYMVDDVDAAYARALKAGATSVRAPENAFYGDRTSAIQDPFGNSWGIATHVEDVPPDELKKRAEEFQKQFACAAGE